MRRTKEDAEQTRRLIMDTALERFAAQGIAGCSLVEIASHAGITRGAIYWHFKNKDELLEAIITDFAAPLIAMEQAIIDEHEADPLGKLLNLLTFLLRSIATDLAYRHIVILCQRTRTLSFDEQGEPTCLSKKLDEMTLERRQRRMRVLDNAVSKGQLGKHINTAAAADFILASVEGIAFAWLAAPESFSLENLASTYAKAILTAVASIEANQ